MQNESFEDTLSRITTHDPSNASTTISERERALRTKSETKLTFSLERKSQLFDQIDKTAQFFSAFGHPAYLAGGLGLSIGIEQDIYRDQTDVDVEMDDTQKAGLFTYARKEMYLVVDPEKNKQVFSSNNLPRRLSFIKSKMSTSSGPDLCEVYFFKKNEDGWIQSAFLDLPFPSDAYDNSKTFKTDQGNEILLSPPEVQLFYKACYAMLYSRAEDTYDIRRFLPQLTEDQHERLKAYAAKAFPVFFDKVRENL